MEWTFVSPTITWKKDCPILPNQRGFIKIHSDLEMGYFYSVIKLRKVHIYTYKNKIMLCYIFIALYWPWMVGKIDW